jgi:O-antigen/teichoic acid export membrane protein
MLKSNIVANFLGAGYGMALQFVMVPVTLHYLGPQAYGLVGIYATLVAILSVLDLGLAPALTRELSRLSVLGDGIRLMRSTVTTLEIVSICSAVGVGLLIWMTAPLLAKYWFTSSNLSSDLVTVCLQWLGLQSAFQFLTNYYSSGLVGLQRIILGNAVAALTHTLRTIALLWLLVTKPDIELYFICQAVTSLVAMAATACALYFALSAQEKISAVLPKQEIRWRVVAKLTNRYSHERFLSCRRYAAGMAATALSTLLLTQLDKIILSKMLSLEDFGYYTIAGSLASLLAKPAGLVLGATLPRMTQLAISGETAALTRVYFKASALVSWLVLPTAGILIGFSEPLLNLYLRNSYNAHHIAPLVAALAVGSALHSISFIPYGLTLAYGWSRFGVNFGLIGCLTLLPFIILATRYYGALGAAAMWALLCFSYVTIFMAVIHRKYLSGVLSAWYRQVCFWQGLACIGLTCLGFFVGQL